MSEESEKLATPSAWKRVGKIFARIVLYGLLLFLLLVLSSVFIWPLEFVFHLIAGPFFHAWKTLPPFFSQWRSALLPLACLALAIVLGHRFIRWWIHTKGIQMTWHWKHTAAAASLLLLGSAAAIAMSGITHQAAWLVSSPWVESNRNKRLTATIGNARQIMLVLWEYENTHKKYPDTLEEALKALDVPTSMLWVETGPDELREPFIFLKPGQSSAGLIAPVIVSPVIRPYDKVVVGFSDNSARMLHLKAWQKMAKELQAEHE
jgi:hypothetical protein